jgi:hypothetical protein
LRRAVLVAGAIIAITGSAGLATGCSAGDDRAPAGLLRPAETSVPKGTDDPRVGPAVEAYQRFLQAAAAAQQKPVADEASLPKEADFSLFSFDPIVSEYAARIRGLSLAKREFRGTPPQSNLTVTSIDPDAPNFPTVTLSDCQTGLDNWQLFDITTGKSVVDQEPTIPRPFGVSVSVIYSRQRWGVHTITLDSTRTCQE